MGELHFDFPADGVVRVTLDNVAKRNALDVSILEGLARELPQVDARCVIVTGAGDAFSAGYDLGGLTPEGLADVLIHPFEAAMAALDAVPVPIVAALGGHAFGGGLELAVACDLRVCAPGARLGMPPARLGVVYSHTGLRRFVDAIGSARTRELFLTARPVSADEALAWGLVNEVVDDVDARSVELASEIAALSSVSVRGNKRVLQALIPPLDPVLVEELDALRRDAFTSAEFAEGVRSFVEKRPPRWPGR
ncbi:enoyl-CoA hydratase/isomerase family protein [Solirubrobacter sp. CPCC 204708]|uniref:Enoyl-CoA hydratase/isomerase family protein n=1 Tax=Solirubrobacter deserti TaxID=2282478 RepID=A0ABT4RGG1_9ACTN|nr:enoyl-CoA hydratase/isomerase family protein [Solirubrobacter deserti]MBE2318117.1 enoyl-CoA hydratase/isomerase family protein [Solirubrobacter deserti]MDA0137395.1 enoyl-CoA hydratase/isomerase family protein [Solirubrobacter deserti]